MCGNEKEIGTNSLRAGEYSKPIKQVKALGVDIEPSERFGWCYVFYDGVCLGKVVWIEVEKAYQKTVEVIEEVKA